VFTFAVSIASSRTNYNDFACQLRNRLGNPGEAKNFLRGAPIFKLFPIVLNYAQHIFPGGVRKNLRRFLPLCTPGVTGLLVATSPVPHNKHLHNQLESWDVDSLSSMYKSLWRYVRLSSWDSN